MVEQSATKLEAMSAELGALAAQIEALHQWSLELRHHVRDSEASRSDLLSRLDAVASDTTAALSRLSEAERDRDRHAMELTEIRRALHSAEAQRDAHQRALTDALTQRDSLATDHTAARRHAEDLLAELRHLRETSRAANAAKEAAEGSLHSAQQERVVAQDVASRAQTALAKVAADNVILVMRCGELERSKDTLEKEKEELRAEVEDGRGGWLDGFRSEVEKRVGESLVQIRDLERQLTKVAEERNEEEKGWRRKLGELEGVLAEALEREGELTLLLDGVRKENAGNQLDRKHAKNAQEKAEKIAEAKTAEVKVLHDHVKHARDEAQGAIAAKEEAETTREQVLQRCEGLEAELRQRTEELDETRARLATQQQANRELLQRKADIEMDLVQAIAENTRLKGGTTDKGGTTEGGTKHHQASDGMGGRRRRGRPTAK